MPTNLPFDLNGPEADQLRAVLAGHEAFFSARVNWNGRTLTMLIALEGYDPTTAPQPEAQPEPEYDHSSRIKDGWPGGGPARTPVVTGERSSEYESGES